MRGVAGKKEQELILSDYFEGRNWREMTAGKEFVFFEVSDVELVNSVLHEINDLYQISCIPDCWTLCLLCSRGYAVLITWG